MANSSDVLIDLTGYRDRTGSRVAPGKYRVQVEDVENTTANSGNPMINVWLRVVGGEFDGSTIVDRLVITEKSLFRVVGFMQAIGVPTPKKRLRVNVDRWKGKVLDVDVEDGDPYNGRVKSEVRGYYRIPKAEQTDGDLDIDTADDQDAPEQATTSETPATDDAPATPSPEAAEEPKKPAPKPAAASAEDDDEVDLDALDNL